MVTPTIKKFVRKFWRQFIITAWDTGTGGGGEEGNGALLVYNCKL